MGEVRTEDWMKAGRREILKRIKPQTIKKARAILSREGESENR